MIEESKAAQELRRLSELPYFAHYKSAFQSVLSELAAVTADLAKAQSARMLYRRALLICIELFEKVSPETDITFITRALADDFDGDNQCQCDIPNGHTCDYCKSQNGKNER